MKIWRMLVMNKDQVISNMITYIEQAERDLQATSFASESKTSKNEIVNSILNKLEQEIEDEN